MNQATGGVDGFCTAPLFNAELRIREIRNGYLLRFEGPGYSSDEVFFTKSKANLMPKFVRSLLADALATHEGKFTSLDDKATPPEDNGDGGALA
jgi:hypothetical protein